MNIAVILIVIAVVVLVAAAWFALTRKSKPQVIRGSFKAIQERESKSRD